MSFSRRGLVKAIVTLAALVLLAVPAAVFVAAGWIEVTFTPWGEQPGPDPTPIEVWALLALVYLVWAPLLLAGLVVAHDRLGYRFTPVERRPRPSAKERRRRGAGLRFVAPQEAPPPRPRRRRPPKEG